MLVKVIGKNFINTARDLECRLNYIEWPYT